MAISLNSVKLLIQWIPVGTFIVDFKVLENVGMPYADSSKQKDS